MLCTEKVVFESRQAAQDAGDLIVANSRVLGKRARDRRIQMRPYRCPQCSKWHLTKQRPRH